MREAWKEKLTRCGGKLPLPALAVVAAGCLLLLLPTGAGEAAQPPPDRQREEFVLEEFEDRLERALSRIQGAGDTRVVLTLDSGSREVLAQDREERGDDRTLQTVTVGSGSQQSVVPLQTISPSFRGALVVSPGAGDSGVRLELTKAVSVLTGLRSDRICVTTGGTS